jgi:hypothetical protein
VHCYDGARDGGEEEILAVDVLDLLCKTGAHRGPVLGENVGGAWGWGGRVLETFGLISPGEVEIAEALEHTNGGDDFARRVEECDGV